MTNPILLAAAALFLPAVWGFLVWWIVDRTWPVSAGSTNGGPSAPSESNVLDFQI